MDYHFMTPYAEMVYRDSKDNVGIEGIKVENKGKLNNFI
jgi:hypothetical protein